MTSPGDPSTLSRKRPWLAAVLSVFIPGLGHLYLRLWIRALLWLGMSILATWLVVPESLVPESFSIEALFDMSSALSTEGTLLLLGVAALCVVDSFVMAKRINHVVDRVERGIGGGGGTCPNCGKELDADIDFCHWCTTELGTFEEE